MTDHAELIDRLRAVMAGWRIGDETEATLDAAVAEIAAVLTPIHRENADLRAEVERLREAEEKTAFLLGAYIIIFGDLKKDNGFEGLLGHTQGGR